ncbi:hypothetical protein [Sulfitobacter sp.]|uniref:hypothetical protein n=1 Tax=Sulfitobacter sp. TaxID=1903071 RepID=UPI003001B2A3
MAPADDVTAIEYARTLITRAALIAEATRSFSDITAIMPSVAIIAPKLKELRGDAAYDRINLLALRNTRFGYQIDRWLSP